MAIVLANQQGWHPQNDLQFKVIGPFAGDEDQGEYSLILDLRSSVNTGQAAAFMWEHFTTKPFVDSGEVRFIGEITTPWRLAPKILS
jgi:hypothetical protein